MALLPRTFNAAEVDPASTFQPVPPGEYAVMITDSEMKGTKDGKGEYLKLTFKIIQGEFENRFIWANLNLINQSSQAQEIAERELSAICHAIDVMVPEDSQELHGIPMCAKVKVTPAKGQYAASNTIGGFKSIEEYSPE